MGAASLSDGLVLAPALPKRAERRVQGHGHEVGRHPVGGRVERLAEVLPHIRSLRDLPKLEAIPDRFSDLGGSEFFVTYSVRDGVDQRDRLPDSLRRGPAAGNATVTHGLAGTPHHP